MSTDIPAAPSLFSRTLDELRSTLSGKTDSEVILELMALTRRIGDGHTAIRVNGNIRFPLELYYIDGGWRVVGVDQEHEERLGSSIVSIDGRPVEARRREQT